MVDSFTPNYSIVQPTVGGDSGTWGGILNAGVMGVLDNILGAAYSTSITSADVTLTTTQFQNAIFIVNGTATGNHSLVLPFQTNAATVAVGGKFIVVNNQTGAFNLTVKTGTAGASAIVPQGFGAALYSDGTNVNLAMNGVPGFAQSVSGNPNGQLAGTAGSVNTNAQLAYDYTNNYLYLCTASGTAGSAVWATPSVVVPRGFDTAVNLSFTTAVSTNVLTVTAVAANTGTTPRQRRCRSPRLPLAYRWGRKTVCRSGSGSSHLIIPVRLPWALSIVSARHRFIRSMKQRCNRVPA